MNKAGSEQEGGWISTTARTRGIGAAWTLLARIALYLSLAALYYIGAARHADRVNKDMGPGDQSAYMRYAKEMARTRYQALGDRNRMPLYPAFQSLFYPEDPAQHAATPTPPTPPTPAKSRGLLGGLLNRLKSDEQKAAEQLEAARDAEFFRRGKQANILLSLVLLAILCVVFSWYLPPMASTALTLVIAFGVFIFKAGYFQADLLFYFFHFLTFLACCELLRRRSAPASAALGVIAGVLAALAYLTKAANLPFVLLFLAVFFCNELLRLIRPQKAAGTRSGLPLFAKRMAAGGLLLVCFLAVLWPYLSNSKRVFGQYFYNVNSTFYVWYDNWGQATRGTKAHGDRVGWPTMPPEQIPSARKYFREHTAEQVLARLGGGFADMVRESYAGFWYMKYVLAYAAFGIILIATRPRPSLDVIRKHPGISCFLVLYAMAYLLMIAFYAPISHTGTTRFLLAHATPLLFALAWWSAHPGVAPTEWRLGGVLLTPSHFHLLMLVTVGLDLSFSIWPRLMTRYSGF